MTHSHTKHKTQNMIAGEHSPKELTKFVLVIVAIFVVALWLNGFFTPGGPMNFLRWFMGVFFVVFASFKFIGYKMFVPMFMGYDIIAKQNKSYAYAYPFIEFGLGLLYIFDWAPIARDVATVVIMGVGSIGVFQEIQRRSGIHCACLGNVIKLPLSTVSLVEDVGMGLMALVMLVLR